MEGVEVEVQGEQSPVVATFDLSAVRRFADLVVVGLGEAREEIDALNVYPVPDGDTGTNMYLTVEAARTSMQECLADRPQDLPAALHAYARGALLGARGNSGVILSQLVGALFARMAASGPADRSAAVLADGLVAATDAAYAAVGEPVEGTILTVARAASTAAIGRAADPQARLGDVLHAAVLAAAEALEHTPEQLELLRRAGVVDAGGRGLCVVLASAETAVTGQRAVSVPGQRAHHIPVLARAEEPAPALAHAGDLTEDGPAYEVMYLLDADEQAIAPLRRRLAGLGDSLVVVGAEGLWNVHVHVDDVGAAIEAGIEAGVPRRIQVTHFAEQIERARARQQREGRSVVAVVAGPGLAALFEEAGAHVLRSGPHRRPSTGEVLEAILDSGGREVIVLPNDSDTVGVAEAAAHEAADQGVRAVVIPTRAQVQGIAALAVHEPGRAFDADVVQMTSAARGARHGGVTIAARDAMTMAGPCAVGDALGVVMGDFAVVGQDLGAVALGVLERLLAGGGELVTLVRGADCGDLAETCERWLAAEHPSVDVVVHDGGQDRYPLLVSVE